MPHHTTPHHTTPHHTNFFSPQDHFFIIDSQDLGSVKTKFYGFSVQESGIYDRQNMTPEALAGLDGTGVYVSVERTGDEILIRQDFIGSYGLYLYNRDGHFVLSNSFLYLMDYLSKRIRLTLNKDYANHYLVMDVSSMDYSGTFVNEIQILPRDEVIKINIPSASFSTENINYHENTVWLNSREGMDILDKWAAKWTGILKNLYAKTCNIQVDLSGGLDSRMSFALLVNSGIDLSRICVNSFERNIHPFTEDRAIAEEIGRHFGFTVNNRKNFTGGELHYTLDDALSIVFHARAFGSLDFSNVREKSEDKRFCMTGHNGETVRQKWHPSEKSFIKGHQHGTRKFSAPLRKELADSTERILTRMLDEVSHKSGVPISDDLASNVYRATWGRSHFGTAEVVGIFRNHYTLNPLGDPVLSRLKLYDKDCTDQNLLMAVIHSRYCPELLKFRFTNDERIAPATVKFAEKITAQFPRAEAAGESREFSVVIRDPEVSKLLANDNPPLGAEAFHEYFTKIFYSREMRHIFASRFDEELSVYAEIFRDMFKHRPMYRMVQIITAAEIVNYVIRGEAAGERTIADDLREFAEAERLSESDKYSVKLLKIRLLSRAACQRIITLPAKVMRKLINKLKSK